MRCFLLAAAGVLVLSLSGCGAKGGGSGGADKSEPTEAEVNAAVGFVPLSRPDVESLAEKIQTAVAEADASSFRSLVDHEALIDRVFAGLDVGDEFRTGYRRGLENQGGIRTLIDQIIAVAQNGGSYELVRYVEDGDEIRPLFRLSMGIGEGLNYHELRFSRDKGQQPKLADIFVYLSGEYLSQTLRRMTLPAIASMNRSLLEKVAGSKSSAAKDMDRMVEVVTAMQAGQHQQALTLIEGGPESFRKDKSILMLKLLAAQMVDEKAYTKTILQLESLFPDDPGNDFRAIDRLAAAGDHDGVLRCVGRLQKRIQDPYLDLLRVDSLVELGRTDEAVAAAEAARTALPTNVDPVWTLIGCGLQTKDHALIAGQLDVLTQDFGIEIGDLTQVPEYADFAKSPEYKAWLDKQ